MLSTRLTGSSTSMTSESMRSARSIGDDAPGRPVALDGTDRLVTLPDGNDTGMVLAEGTNLVAPSIDRFGWTWTTPRVSDGTVQAYQPNGAASSVTASWLEDASVRALRISRDATRALVIRENDGVVQAEVAAVMREPDGRPVSLGDPVVICEMLVSAGDATWVDEQTVAVLGTSGADTTTAVLLECAWWQPMAVARSSKLRSSGALRI